MPRNILVDLNVILDVLLEREHYESSLKVLELPKTTDIQLYISAHEVTTFSFLLEQAKVPRIEVKRQIAWLIQSFTIVPTTLEVLTKASASHVIGYEDAVIEQAAASCAAELIITRNIRDFTKSVVPAETPDSFVKHL